jgi:hypothetical protein
MSLVGDIRIIYNDLVGNSERKEKHLGDLDIDGSVLLMEP